MTFTRKLAGPLQTLPFTHSLLLDILRW